MNTSTFSFVGPCLKPRKNFVTIDIETFKLDGPHFWASGEKNSKRWCPFIVGIGFQKDEKLTIEVGFSFREQEIISWTESKLEKLAPEKIFQNSFNKFDEMVLKGRFINGRRAISKEKGDWPTISPHWQFDRISPFQKNPFERNEPEAKFGIGAEINLLKKGNLEPVKHCARDILENAWNICERPALDLIWEEFWTSPLI